MVRNQGRWSAKPGTKMKLLQKSSRVSYWTICPVLKSVISYLGNSPVFQMKLPSLIWAATWSITME